MACFRHAALQARVSLWACCCLRLGLISWSVVKEPLMLLLALKYNYKHKPVPDQVRSRLANDVQRDPSTEKATCCSEAEAMEGDKLPHAFCWLNACRGQRVDGPRDEWGARSFKSRSEFDKITPPISCCLAAIAALIW